MEKIDSKNLDSQFKYDIAGFAGGENIKLCYACGTCTAGCPVSEIDSEFNPRKIIRQVLRKRCTWSISFRRFEGKRQVTPPAIGISS